MTDVKEPQLGRQVARGMVSVAGSSVAVTIIRMGSLFVLARLLIPSDFGTVAAALLTATFAQIFFLRGIAPALIQREDLEKTHEHSAFLGVLLGGTAAAVLLLIFAPWLAGLLGAEQAAPVMRVFASMFVVNGATVVPNALHRRNLQFGRLATAEVAGTLVGYAGISITLASFGFGLWALVAGNVAQSIVTLAMLWRTHPPEFPRQASKRGFRQLYRTSSGFSLGAFGLFLSNKADYIGISRVLGADALGIYTNAFRLMAEPSDRLGQVFSRVLLPAMSRIQNERDRLRSAYLDGAGTVALVTLPIGLVAAFTSKEIVLVLLGSQWSEAAGPFGVLAGTMTLRTSFRLSESVVGATGAVFRRAWRQWAFAVMVIAAVWIGSRWGLTAVAAGVCIAMAVNWLLMAQLANREVDATWTELLVAHLPALRTGSLATVAGVLAATVLRSIDSPAAVVVLGAFAAAGSVAALLVIGLPEYFSTKGLKRLLRGIQR